MMNTHKVTIETDVATLFTRWFVYPLHQLETIPNGDGGFIALATCCFLYERYARAYLKDNGEKATDAALVAQFASDFVLSEPDAQKTWDVIRNGILHQGMPKQSQRGTSSLPEWEFNAAFRHPFQIVVINSRERARVQPWLFRDKVLSLFQARPDLIAKSPSFPWGAIATARAIPDVQHKEEA